MGLPDASQAALELTTDSYIYFIINLREMKCFLSYNSIIIGVSRLIKEFFYDDEQSPSLALC